MVELTIYGSMRCRETRSALRDLADFNPKFADCDKQHVVGRDANVTILPTIVCGQFLLKGWPGRALALCSLGLPPDCPPSPPELDILPITVLRSPTQKEWFDESPPLHHWKASPGSSTVGLRTPALSMFEPSAS
eukprot:NODE_11990_length_528_cov_35.345679_g11702_i0.p1 GENE.NODE_11990_length_528_cov_35.345679_g11702_i0~~NODE_11990_length_528_cov_35.345679_g11702_i0.p1  ORF type:complete len:134 (+),score=15.91 NODE_11990_length_528_cov_35.345679_g11702_i0:110-511(+)